MSTETPSSPGRRDFLKTVAVGAAAMAAGAPAILRADEPVIVGSGNNKYEWIAGWDKKPENVVYGNTHGVQVDSQGRVIVHTTSKNAIIIYDADGKFIKTWGEKYGGGAHGLQLRKEGGTEFLYLADTRGTVYKTTLDGEEVWSAGAPKDVPNYAKPGTYKPTNVAFAPNGDFYVADGYGQSLIHIYNIKGEYQKTFGEKGKGPGQMNCPHGLWVDTRGGKDPVLVVADRANVRLQYFTLDGKHISFVNEELRHPCHFDVFGDLLLIPDLHSRVTLFDKDNKLVTHLGDNPDLWKNKPWPNTPIESRKPGKFNSPHGACFDKDGNIYVVEWVPQGRVTKLKKIS